MGSASDDSSLVSDLVSGCPDAWVRLIDLHGGLVRSRVVDVARVFGRREDWSTIDDVTAEVFATLLARDGAALRCFRGQSRLSTYLAVIATRVARRVIAHACRIDHHQSESLDELPSPTDAPNAESSLIDQEEREHLLTLVDRLPVKQRELVVAFYRQELTYVQISDRFDIPIGSIGKTLRQAEQRLRQWMNDETA